MSIPQPRPRTGAIAAMTRNSVIGLNGSVPWHYSEDLKRFKRVTMDSTIIMGRLTWESIGGRPLPGRRNIVISRNSVDDVECFTGLEEALSQSADEVVWIIGGGQIYSAALPWLTWLDITYVPDAIEHPDAVLFPQIDPAIWQVAASTPLPDSTLVNVEYQRRN